MKNFTEDIFGECKIGKIVKALELKEFRLSLDLNESSKLLELSAIEKC